MRDTAISLARLAVGTHVAAALRRFKAKPAEALAAIGITTALNRKTLPSSTFALTPAGSPA